MLLTASRLDGGATNAIKLWAPEVFSHAANSSNRTTNIQSYRRMCDGADQRTKLKGKDHNLEGPLGRGVFG